MERNKANRILMQQLLDENDALKKQKVHSELEHKLRKQEIKGQLKQALANIAEESKHQKEKDMLEDSDSIQLRLK